LRPPSKENIDTVPTYAQLNFEKGMISTNANDIRILTDEVRADPNCLNCYGKPHRRCRGRCILFDDCEQAWAEISGAVVIRMESMFDLEEERG